MTHSTAAVDHERAGAPLPIPYTAEEVARTFTELLGTLTFLPELHDLGISSLHVIKRRRVKRHLAALSIALWHVALEKSFPHDAQIFFTHFRETYPPLLGEKRGTKTLRELVDRYDALVAEKKDGDFTGVAEELINAFSPDPSDRAKLQLRLSLRVRSIYHLIFEKLI